MKTLKTAGTSVEVYFEDACIPPESTIRRGHHIEETVTPAGVIGYRGADPSGRTWYNHMSAQDVRGLVGSAIWNDYYKFCVVRNPFDKLVSLWWFNNSKRVSRYADVDFLNIRTDFSRWCIGHAHQAVDRDKYLIDGEISLDFIIKYESLLEGLESVCHRVLYPFRPERLKKLKGNTRVRTQSFADYYNPPAIAAVESAFAWEFANFGYSRLSPTP